MTCSDCPTMSAMRKVHGRPEPEIPAHYREEMIQLTMLRHPNVERWKIEAEADRILAQKLSLMKAKI